MQDKKSRNSNNLEISNHGNGLRIHYYIAALTKKWRQIMTAVPCHRIRSQATPVMNMLLPLTSRWTIRSLCTCFKAMQSCVTQFFTLPMGSSKSFLAPPAPPGPRVYRWTQPTSANLDLANLANLKIHPPFLSHHWWDMYRFYKYV